MVRKRPGHHIPRFAAEGNAFARDVPTPYLHYHHPCLFATEAREPTTKIVALAPARRPILPHVHPPHPNPPCRVTATFRCADGRTLHLRKATALDRIGRPSTTSSASAPPTAASSNR